MRRYDGFTLDEAEALAANRPRLGNNQTILALVARVRELEAALRQAKPKIRLPTDRCDCVNCRGLERLHDAIDALLSEASE